MNKKICIVVAMLLMCTSTLLILSKEPNVGAISTEKITFCFDSYDPDEAWEINPEGMLCCGYGYAATTIDGDVQLLNHNTCPDNNLGTITSVKIRTCGFYHPFGNSAHIILRPVFDRDQDGDNHTFDVCLRPSWSDWLDITNDNNSPGSGHWTWTDVTNLNCDVEAENNPLGSWFMLFCGEVEIRVTYTT